MSNLAVIALNINATSLHPPGLVVVAAARLPLTARVESWSPTAMRTTVTSVHTSGRR